MMRVSNREETRSFVKEKHGNAIGYLCAGFLLMLLALSAILVAFGAPEETVRLALGSGGALVFVVSLVVVVDFATEVYRYHKILKEDRF